MNELVEHDVVRVLAMPIVADEANRCAPGLGDRGAVIQVLRAETHDDRYVVESIGRRGLTLWIAEFDASKLERAVVSPGEPLAVSSMASGHRALLMRRGVPWSQFPNYADSVAARLSAVVVEAADDPSLRLRILSIDSNKYWLSWEEHGGEVSLEPCGASSDDAMKHLRQRLAISRPVFDAVFELVRAGKESRLRSGCAELDYFLNDELRDGGSVDDSVEESLVLELAHQIQDLRAGRTHVVRNGSDAVFVSLSAGGVRLEYAIPNSPRPGPTLTFHSFVEVFVQWFELVNPLLGVRVRDIVWPRSLLDTGRVDS